MTAPILVAVDGSAASEHVTAEAARIALLRHRPVHVLHVQETDVVGDAAIALESRSDADAILAARVAQLRAAGVVADGEVLRSTGRHADVASNICAAAEGASVIVLGRGDATELVTRDAPANVLVVA